MSWTAERARVASLSRSRTPDDPDLKAARERLKAARQLVKTAALEAYITRVVSEAPPLTTEQRDHLASLFRQGSPRNPASRIPMRVRPEDGRAE